ncbi:hypothetical protein Poly30_47870 [Planctomycetes bacterium Poly30]|uniref:Uncharacterized protein n=1 Tax=Saltatorellus ferox TaxID=2528018 RepID=A0A518EYR5_9BACT|nr:hypothetical protein Poly30_47870 [Planctomycetes bacterium Poly30]
MAYYIRHFGLRDGKVSEKELTRAIQNAGLRGSIHVDSHENGRWTAITVNLAKKLPVAYIERCAVSNGSLGAKAIQEFQEELDEMRPESAATWIGDYLEKVQVVHAVQLLHGIEEEDAWPLLDVVQGAISDAVGGIVQADAEGFMNELAEFITCDFPDGLEGLVRAAVMDAAGDWKSFDLDLADRQQIKAFRDGTLQAAAVEATKRPRPAAARKESRK